jgi:hypothetical protein
MKHVYGLKYLSVRERYEYLLVNQQSEPYLDLIAINSDARDVFAINPRIASTPSLLILPLLSDLHKS